MKIPRWLRDSVGLYTPADAESERIVLGLAMQGVAIPSIVRPEHFFSPWYQRVFCACRICGGNLLDVARLLRSCRLLHAHEAADLGEMYEAAQYVAEPDWQEFVARAELRNRVVVAESNAERLRLELRRGWAIARA